MSLRHNPIRTATAVTTAEANQTPPLTIVPLVAPPPAGPATNVIPLPQPTAAPPAATVKKIKFGITAKKAESKLTNYPVLVDASGEAAKLAARILERSERLSALTAAIKADKEELRGYTLSFYFNVNHSKVEIPSSISVTAAPQTEMEDRDGNLVMDGDKVVMIDTPGKEVLVSYQDKYGLLADESTIAPILGKRIDEFFVQSFEITINSEKLPADKTQELIDKMQTVFAEYNATDALELVDGFKPKSTFHIERHQKLTVEDNLRLENACPMGALVKTKGRAAR